MGMEEVKGSNPFRSTETSHRHTAAAPPATGVTCRIQSYVEQGQLGHGVNFDTIHYQSTKFNELARLGVLFIVFRALRTDFCFCFFQQT
jgi:hypothetical protein